MSGPCAGRVAAARARPAGCAARWGPAAFAVVQGGGVEALRRQCATALADRLRWLRLRRLAARRRRCAARRADALGRRVAPARGSQARARGRPARSRRQRIRPRLLGVRLRAPRGRPPRPALRVPRWLVATEGRDPATTSTAPSASTIRRIASPMDRSRTDATVRSVPVTRRPTCTTCSRSGTRRPRGWPRCITCASTSGSSRCARSTSGVGSGLDGVLATERVRAHASRARGRSVAACSATADASSDPATAGTRPVCGRTIRPAGVSSGSSSPAISSPTIAVAGTTRLRRCPGAGAPEDG